MLVLRCGSDGDDSGADWNGDSVCYGGCGMYGTVMEMLTEGLAKGNKKTVKHLQEYW